MQAVPNLVHDFPRALRDIDYDRLLGLFQIQQLTPEDGLSGKVPVPGMQARGDQSGGTLQIHKAHLGTGAEPGTISAFQSRAGKDDILSIYDPVLDRLPQPIKPGFPVLIGKRSALPDLFYVGRRVKVININKLPTELGSEQISYRRL